MHTLKTPEAPLSLTALGAIPFLVPAGLMVLRREDPVLLNTVGLWLIVYAAMILSFLGGVRWGVEMTQRDKPRFFELLLSVLGSLIGWGSVLAYFQYGANWVFLVPAAGLLFYFVVDRVSSEMPVWYRRMRIWPTSVAMGCLLVPLFLLGRL